MSINTIDKFWGSRARMDDPKMATRFRPDNTMDYDYELITKYLTSESEVLDLGCGTCALTNQLAPHVAFIRGVDKQEGLLRFAEERDNLDTVVGDVTEYRDDIKYDVILLIGVLNYVLDDEMAAQVYKNVYEMLKDGGCLIVKQQSGVFEDVLVDNYSEELKCNYVALYRHQEKDISLMTSQGFTVETIDIYPPELNLWENTHHYAYVAKKDV